MRARLPPREPSLVVWLLAAVSLVLPWIGVPLALAGGLGLAHGWSLAWPLLLFGVGLVVLDVLIDFVWAGLTAGQSDDPTLNRGGLALVGRKVHVEEAIRNGRGKVRAGDTLWLAEGPDAPAGDLLRVNGVRATVLLVEHLNDPPQPPPASP